MSSALASRRFFVDRPADWQLPAIAFAACLAGQLALLFVESKEEQELSLQRKRRLQEIEFDQRLDIALADEMDKALKVKDLARFKKLDALRKR